MIQRCGRKYLEWNGKADYALTEWQFEIEMFTHTHAHIQTLDTQTQKG